MVMIAICHGTQAGTSPLTGGGGVSRGQASGAPQRASPPKPRNGGHRLHPTGLSWQSPVPTPNPAPRRDPMSRLTLHRNHTRDLSPLARLLADPDDLTLVNPHAAQPFDPGEWAMKWVGERDDETFYLLDDAGLEVGFVALRVGIGPEVRHLTYVFVEERMRGGTGEELARLAETAARDLGALSITLKVELDNEPALNLYRKAGYEELSRRGGMATMRRDLGG